MKPNEQSIAEAYAKELQTKFPDLHIGGVTPSPVDNGESYWVYTDEPSDFEQRVRLLVFASELSMTYLAEHEVLVMPISGVSAPAHT